MKRRQFLKGGAILAAALPTEALPVANLFSKEKNTPNLRVGVIGCGVRGAYLIKLLHEKVTGAAVTACCDIYAPNLQKAMGLLSADAKGYTDYRYIIDNQEIDAVVIATPLHLH